MPQAGQLWALNELERHRWLQQARPEQREPEGDWRVWFLKGGRGSGKTRTGAETLARWVRDNEPGDWAIVAPTYGDARNVCTEGPSGILLALEGIISQWNRSLGEISTTTGSRIFLDGADDGALRIQGENLRGVWCDEIGLWRDWQRAWNESLAFAVRMEPARIVATGTPKMGHGLVRQLIEDPRVPVSDMRMEDNIANLAPGIVEELRERYAGTRLGRQELEGEWIASLEGDALLTEWWRYYEPRRNDETDAQFIGRMPRFVQVVCSWDTPLKDKESSDFVAGQCWGVHGGDRFMLDSRHGHMNYSTTKRQMQEMAEWARSMWPNARHATLIENAGFGVELVEDLKRLVPGVHKVNPGPIGSKGMRALSASGDLETGNCFVPGYADPSGSGPDDLRSPAATVAFIAECAMFRLDGTQDSHDDQVDAWSQAMNWLKGKSERKARVYGPPDIRL